MAGSLAGSTLTGMGSVKTAGEQAGGGGAGTIDDLTTATPAVTITNPTGPTAQIDVDDATTTDAGLMSAADKLKLDSVPTGHSGRITLSGTGRNFVITGLHGDTDGDYEFYGCLFFASAIGNVTISCLPNSDVTAFGQGEFLQGQTATPYALNVNSLFVNTVNTTTPGTIMTFHARLRSKSGEGPRMWECSTYSTEAGGHSTVQTTAYWTETATEFTSIEFFAGIANSLLAGSYVAWRSLGFTA